MHIKVQVSKVGRASHVSIVMLVRLVLGEESVLREVVLDVDKSVVSVGKVLLDEVDRGALLLDKLAVGKIVVDVDRVLESVDNLDVDKSVVDVSKLALIVDQFVENVNM